LQYGVANAVNIIDGFNGLTAGTAIIMLAAFGFIARQVEIFRWHSPALLLQARSQDFL
jgi:UDP-N-acetylmuramyl pentapeptide phosphotransferase/UDP-N-acetylglucosamine-1-phosphate transferase